MLAVIDTAVAVHNAHHQFIAARLLCYNFPTCQSTPAQTKHAAYLRQAQAVSCSNQQPLQCTAVLHSCAALQTELQYIAELLTAELPVKAKVLSTVPLHVGAE